MNEKNKYTLHVNSPSSDGRDEYEIAELVIKNLQNNKEFGCAIWRDESTFEDLLELGATYLFLPDLQMLNVNDKLLNLDKKALEEVFENDLLENYALDDIITFDKVIEQALRSEDDFSIKIDDSNINATFVNALIIEREIIEMTYKAHSNELTKQDILDFGKLVDQENNEFNFNKNAFSYLQEPVENVLKNEGVTRIERKYIKKAFEALQLDTSNLPKEKKHKKEMELER